MTRPTYNRVCQCCGTDFIARHPGAKWCGSTCTVRAYQRRRRGALEADSRLNLAIQAAELDDSIELPAAWQQQSAPGHEARIWAGTAITRRQADGYVNATAMCQANGKQWHDYVRYDRSQAYIDALRQHLEWIPEDPKAHISSCLDAPELVITTTSGPNHLRGTWIHPRLAIDLARWISPQFAVWMDGWFLESLNRPQQPQQHTLPLTPGIHVVAKNQRQANWLWGLAVEQHVSSALMTQIAADNSCRSEPSYQLHLLP